MPLVRCRLGDAEARPDHVQRYVPLAEYGLWKYLMETRHRKRVILEAVSVWVPEEPALWNSGFSAEDLEPVLRIQFTVRGPLGALVPVERYVPALGYPRAQEALLLHYARGSGPRDIKATAGYFLPLSRSADATEPSIA